MIPKPIRRICSARQGSCPSARIAIPISSRRWPSWRPARRKRASSARNRRRCSGRRRLLEPAKAASLFETHIAKPWRTCRNRPFTLLLGSTSCGNRPVRRASPVRSAKSVQTAAEPLARNVRIQIITPPGALTRDGQKQLVRDATAIVADVCGDPSHAKRTWVLLTEAAEGGWGIFLWIFPEEAYEGFRNEHRLLLTVNRQLYSYRRTCARRQSSTCDRASKEVRRGYFGSTPTRRKRPTNRASPRIGSRPGRRSPGG
jgi:phenylpyruvate tautomerase PptA (4-oxalocrotonate tautomerase family)